MQYTVNRGEKGKIEVKVDVPQAAFEEAHGKVLGKFQKDATIAGFRPGMAPLDVVEQHFGPSKVLNEAASFLISTHLGDILSKEQLIPLDAPQIAVESLAKGSPFAFTAIFTQKPKVTIRDWKAIKVKKVASREITENDVTESIKNIYEAWKKQKESKSEGKGESEEQAQSGKFIYDAQGNKIFIKDDESKSKVKVESQDKIDDEFAKAIGARDLAHLQELVRKDLETIVNDQVEVQLEQEVFEKIREIGEVEVPEILVEDELNRILVRLNTALEKDGKKLDDYLKEEKTTIDELKNKWREQAAKNVKTSLILDEIGKAEKVTVSKEEMEQAMKGVEQSNLSKEQREDLVRYVVFSIFQAKTLDLVKKTLTA